jgi:hypothetical protein
LKRNHLATLFFWQQELQKNHLEDASGIEVLPADTDELESIL